MHKTTDEIDPNYTKKTILILLHENESRLRANSLFRYEEIEISEFIESVSSWCWTVFIEPNNLEKFFIHEPKN